MKRLILYSGPGCGLCDEALDQLGPVLNGTDWRLEVVDVTTDLELKKRYGLAIPVLQRADTGAELYWPFAAVDLADFLAD